MSIKLIAETAWHHDGDLEFMKALIQNIVQSSKADIIKLHLTLDLDEYMNRNHSIYHYLEKRMFSEDQWASVINSAANKQKQLMLLYNDTRSIRFGAQYKPDYVEIHSVCLNDTYLLETLKDNVSVDTKIVLGVGGTGLNELEYALDILDHDNIVMMFGFQNYPTIYKDLNFRKIKRVMDLFPHCEYGYADHCSWDEPNNILVTVLGAALGMNYIEKHVTTEYGVERTDWNSAISIDLFNEIKAKLEVLNLCMGDGMLKLNAAESEYSVHGPNKKAGVLTQDVNSGTKFTLDMVQYQRSGQLTDLSIIETRVMKTVQYHGICLRAKRCKNKISKKIRLMRIGFLITARLKSTRLPKKILFPLNGTTVIERVIQRARQVQGGGDDIVLCTSYVNQDLPLVEISKAQDISYFNGDPEDVLQRLLTAARLFGYDFVIGITADNPLFSIEYAKLIREMFLEDPGLDFIYTSDLPIGLNIYGMSTNALETVCEVKEIIDTEIWGRLINRPEIFNVRQLEVQEKYISDQYRLTLDEPDDYKLISTLYDMMEPDEIPSLDDIYSILQGDSSLQKINSHVIQKDLDSETIRNIDDYFRANYDKIISVKNQIYNR